MVRSIIEHLQYVNVVNKNRLILFDYSINV